MSIGGYLNQNIMDKLLSCSGSAKSAMAVFDEMSKSEHISSYKNVNPYVFANRNKEIAELNYFFDDPSQKLLLVGGIQGSGKSDLMRSIVSICQEQVMVYWYECSKVTNLDDILLSLCAFFDKRIGKNQSSPLQKSSISIDERLISYLKSLNRSIVIVLDSIEFLVNPEFTIQDEELKQFFNYLLSHPKIKLVLVGQRLPTSDMSHADDFVTELRLSGLSESNSINLLRDIGLETSNTILAEVYKHSRGYPWVMLLAASVAKKLSMDPNKLLEDMSNIEDSFESYLIKMIYRELSQEESKLLNYLSIFRHPINIPTVKNLDKLFYEPDEAINELLLLKLIRSTGKRYHLNATVRKYVYNMIPYDIRYQLHSDISKFYNSEISKKLAERTIRLSRKLLHSEQHFHNSTAATLYREKEKFKQNIKYATGKAKDLQYSQQASEIKPSEDKYIQAIDNSWNNYDYNYEPTEVDSQDLDTNYQLPLSGEEPETKEIVNIDGLELELSEEEKELLEGTDDIVSPPPIEDNQTNINLIEQEDFETNHKIKDDNDDLDIEFDFDKSIDETVSTNLDLVESLVFVAKGYAAENKHNTAIERYQEVLEICEQHNDYELMATVLIAMADSYMALKQYDLSIECYEHCRTIYNELNDFSKLPELLARFGMVYLECYQHEKALAQFSEALRIPEDLLSNQVKASAYLGIGEIHDYRHQFDDALKYYFMALKAFIEINDLLNQSTLYSRIGLIYDDLGQYEKAIYHYEQSLKIDRDLGRKETYAATLSNLAAVCDELGQRSRALKYYKQSIIIDKELNNIEGLYKTLSRVGTIYSEIGKTDMAFTYYKQELKLAKRVKDPYWIAMAFLDLGDLYYYEGDYVKAAKHFFISQKVISKSISTDSREKIDRRIRNLLEYISSEELNSIKRSVLSK